MPYEEPADVDVQDQPGELAGESDGSSAPIGLDVVGEAGDSGSGGCPEGQHLRYGKCVSLGDEPEDDSSVSGGCNAGPATSSTAWPLFLLLALGVFLRRRQIDN